METRTEYLTGKLKGIKETLGANYLYAFDQENNILHLRDKDDHDGVSLINSIDTSFKDLVISIIEKENRIIINSAATRCFIYTDDNDVGFGREIDEYVFSNEYSSENPFQPVKKADRPLLYWYKNKPKNNDLPDFLS